MSKAKHSSLPFPISSDLSLPVSWIFIYFGIICMDVCEGYMHECCRQCRPEEKSDHLKVDIEKTMGWLTWRPATELEASTRKMCTLKYWAILPALNMLWCSFSLVVRNTLLRNPVYTQEVPHALNSSTSEADACESQWVQGQNGLKSEFQDSQDSYTENLSWKTKQQNKTKV